MTCCDYFVKNYNQQVGVSSSKNRNVHRNGGGVGFVQAHSKISFAAQQEQDEHSNVH
jgi:hypothetical protein